MELELDCGLLRPLILYGRFSFAGRIENEEGGVHREPRIFGRRAKVVYAPANMVASLLFRCGSLQYRPP